MGLIIAAVSCAVVIGLKIWEYKYTFPDVAPAPLSFLALRNRDAKLHHYALNVLNMVILVLVVYY